MYKICWSSKLTGVTDCGNPIFEIKEDAQEVADSMNKMEPNIEHWVEYVDVASQ